MHLAIQESIAHLNSLYNQLKQINHLPQLFGEGGLLITSPHYLWSKRHSQASIVARRSRSWWWCSSDCSCHCDRHGCVALCRCCVGDWKALFLLPASLQGCGDKGSHENGNLTRSVREFKSWNSSKYCSDDSLPWRCLESLMPILLLSRVDNSRLAHDSNYLDEET